MRCGVVLLVLSSSWAALACGPKALPGPVLGMTDPVARSALVASLEEAGTAPVDLFSPETILRFSLEADFDQLKKDRSQESEDRPARVLVLGEEGDPVELPIQVRTRGKYRLQRSICPFPPLRLNFQETQPSGTVFDGQDKLKLVTHCHRWDSYEQNVLEEYLAFRIYNHLTEVSFRVQLVEITYLDSSGEDDPVTRMGFLIENGEAMAERVNGTLLDIPGAGAENFEPGQMGMMFVFQYMIGNIDWATANAQNLEILRVGGDHFAIPYDFDWSGLVDAPYVGPSPLTERLHRSVRERLFLGICREEIDYLPILARFQEEREALLATVQNQPRLTEKNRKSATEYIEEFYRIIEDPERAKEDFDRTCKRR